MQPRDCWLQPWERERIIEHYRAHSPDGYRRLTFMRLDGNIVAVRPSTTWRMLRGAGLLRKWNGKESKKGTGFHQPLLPHEHWHIDMSYVNISGTFYYMLVVLDGASRYIVAWDIRTAMTEGEVEIVLERAKETFPHARPRMISDNGPQFIARAFKEYIRISGMTHVRTSPYSLRSNGTLERVNKTIGGVHPTRRTALRGRREAAGGDIRGVLQHRPAPQFNRVRDARSAAHGPTRGDLQREEGETGERSKGPSGQQANHSTSTTQ